MQRGWLRAWQCWDALYSRCCRMIWINAKAGELFRVTIGYYRGAPLQTAEGGVIASGHLILHLHLYNVLLMQRLCGVTDPNRRGLILLQEVRRSLPGLARYVKELSDQLPVAGVVGVTLLHRGAERLGFSVAEVPPTPMNRVKERLLHGMVSFCHPEGVRRLQTNREKLILKRLYMSTQTLLQRYDDPASKEQREPREFLLSEQELLSRVR